MSRSTYMLIGAWFVVFCVYLSLSFNSAKRRYARESLDRLISMSVCIGDRCQMLTDEELLGYARQAYKSYGEVTDFKNYQGNPMPAWEDLPSNIKDAWVNVARYFDYAF